MPRPRSEEDQEEETVRKLSKKEQAELLRQTVDTVGQIGKPGEQIQKVISVGMLSEGLGRQDGYPHYGD